MDCDQSFKALAESAVHGPPWKRAIDYEKPRKNTSPGAAWLLNRLRLYQA